MVALSNVNKDFRDTFFEKQHIRFREDIYKACRPLFTSEFQNLWKCEDRVAISTYKIHTNKCVDLSNSVEQFGAVWLQTFLTALENGAVASVADLDLGFNHIGDVGMQAFSRALAGETLASVIKVDLSGNDISDVGMTAFSTALAGGVLPVPSLR